MGGRGKKIDPNAVEKQKQLIEVFVPRLRQARRESGLMQKDIANALFTTEACVSRWMNGKALPEAVYIPALANVLNVSTDWLLGLDDADQKSVKERESRMAKMELALDAIKTAVIYVESGNED